MKPINKIVITFLTLTLSCHFAYAEEFNNAIEKGHESYVKNCSICHGPQAKGDGIFAELLNIPTADLTAISRYSGGSFPYQEIYLIIDGREHIKVHGPRHMPIWGERFNEKHWALAGDKNADTLIRGKIFELLLYLESIQEL